MKHRMSFEIMVENSDLCYFIYFDTENHLAETIFRFEGVDADIRLEIIVESDPYRTILCRIPIDQTVPELHRSDARYDGIRGSDGLC